METVTDFSAASLLAPLGEAPAHAVSKAKKQLLI
jgi:hypothetical protein